MKFLPHFRERNTAILRRPISRAAFVGQLHCHELPHGGLHKDPVLPEPSLPWHHYQAGKSVLNNNGWRSGRGCRQNPFFHGFPAFVEHVHQGPEPKEWDSPLECVAAGRYDSFQCKEPKRHSMPTAPHWWILLYVIYVVVTPLKAQIAASGAPGGPSGACSWASTWACNGWNLPPRPIRCPPVGRLPPYSQVQGFIFFGRFLRQASCCQTMASTGYRSCQDLFCPSGVLQGLVRFFGMVGVCRGSLVDSIQSITMARNSNRNRKMGDERGEVEHSNQQEGRQAQRSTNHLRKRPGWRRGLATS